MLPNHASHVSFACLVSEMTCVYSFLSLYIFHRCHFLTTLPYAWDWWRNYLNIHNNWYPSDIHKVIIQLIHQVHIQCSLSFPSAYQTCINIMTPTNRKTKIQNATRLACFSCTGSSCFYPWTCTCAHQSIDEFQAALLLETALVSGQTGVGVFMHDSYCSLTLGYWPIIFYDWETVDSHQNINNYKFSKFICFYLKHPFILFSIPFWLSFYQPKYRPVEMKKNLGGLPIKKYCRPPWLVDEKKFSFQIV